MKANIGMLMDSANGEVLESMRANIMFGLFDLGRLMIDNEHKVKAFHDQVADLTRRTYEKVVESVQSGKGEKESVRSYFGIDPSSKPCSSIKANLEELLSFMYGTDESAKSKINGYLKRASQIIQQQYNLHYEN